MHRGVDLVELPQSAIDLAIEIRCEDETVLRGESTLHDKHSLHAPCHGIAVDHLLTDETFRR